MQKPTNKSLSTIKQVPNFRSTMQRTEILPPVCWHMTNNSLHCQHILHLQVLKGFLWHAPCWKACMSTSQKEHLGNQRADAFPQESSVVHPVKQWGTKEFSASHRFEFSCQHDRTKAQCKPERTVNQIFCLLQQHSAHIKIMPMALRTC